MIIFIAVVQSSWKTNLVALQHMFNPKAIEDLISSLVRCQGLIAGKCINLWARPRRPRSLSLLPVKFFIIILYWNWILCKIFTFVRYQNQRIYFCYYIYYLESYSYKLNTFIDIDQYWSVTDPVIARYWFVVFQSNELNIFYEHW